MRYKLVASNDTYKMCIVKPIDLSSEDVCPGHRVLSPEEKEQISKEFAIRMTEPDNITEPRKGTYGEYFTNSSAYDKDIMDLTRLDEGVTLEELRAEHQKNDYMSADVFFIIMIFCIIGGIVAGLIGRSRKIGAVWSFVLGLFLSVIGWIIVASSEKEPEFLEMSNKEK